MEKTMKHRIVSAVVLIVCWMILLWRSSLAGIWDDGQVSYRAAYLYDLMVLFVFPLWTGFAVKKMRDSQFRTGTVVSGVVQILALSIVEILLFKNLSGNFMFRLLFLNFGTVLVEIRLFIWNHCDCKKRWIAGLLFFAYGVSMAGGLLVLAGSAEALPAYVGLAMAGDASSSYYHANVTKLLDFTTSRGASSVLTNDPGVVNFVTASRNPLFYAIYYNGWRGAYLFMLVEFLFLFSIILLMEKEPAQNATPLDVAAHTAAAFLTIRVIFGVLYSLLADLSFGVCLPFVGVRGVIMDSAAMGLVLYYGMSEHMAAIGHRFVSFVKAADEENEEEDVKDDNLPL